jgi:hypothetical protein
MRTAKENVFAKEDLEFHRGALNAAIQAGDVVQAGQSIQNMLELTGWGMQRLCLTLKMAFGTAKTYLAILGLPAKVRDLVVAGRMSNVVAVAFAGLTDEAEQLAFLEHVLRLGVSLKRGSDWPALIWEWRAVKAGASVPEEYPVPVVRRELEGGEALPAPVSVPPVTVRPLGDFGAGTGLQMAERTSKVVDVCGLPFRLEQLKSALERVSGRPVAELEKELECWVTRERVRHALGAVLGEAELLLALVRHMEERAEIRSSARAMVEGGGKDA